MRVIGYIDGMNFYEASKDKRWYLAGWCNWTQTLDAYCPGADISVRYFTTLYSGKAQERIRRQKLHLLAMEKVARAEVVYGACRERQLRCPACLIERISAFAPHGIVRADEFTHRAFFYLRHCRTLV